MLTTGGEMSEFSPSVFVFCFVCLLDRGVSLLNLALSSVVNWFCLLLSALKVNRGVDTGSVLCCYYIALVLGDYVCLDLRVGLSQSF